LRERDRTVLAGICGGMQILGQSVEDPLGIEGGGSSDGLRVFAGVSQFAPEKTTVEVSGMTAAFGEPQGVAGYEIHAGATMYGDDPPFALVCSRDGEFRRDGAIAWDGRAIGTYLHGLFASDRTRAAFLRWACERCALPPAVTFAPIEARRLRRIDALADVVERSLQLELLDPSPVTR
jgi:adenosylcobyric acid synthase